MHACEHTVTTLYHLQMARSFMKLRTNSHQAMALHEPDSGWRWGTVQLQGFIEDLHRMEETLKNAEACPVCATSARIVNGIKSVATGGKNVE